MILNRGITIRRQPWSSVRETPLRKHYYDWNSLRCRGKSPRSAIGRVVTRRNLVPVGASSQRHASVSTHGLSQAVSHPTCVGAWMCYPCVAVSWLSKAVQCTTRPGLADKQTYIQTGCLSASEMHTSVTWAHRRQCARVV
jgi:hypothetical protein